MFAITSLFIPRIDKRFNAEFIANTFEKNGIAKVSKIFIEPYKNNKNRLNNNYYRVFIGIKSWCETETAYNFVSKLRDPSREARIVYSDDNWWPVFINNNINKLLSNKCVLTLFNEKPVDFLEDELFEDELSTTAVIGDDIDDFIEIDSKKTQLLRSIVANFKNKSSDVTDLDNYMQEIMNSREKWFSEQYIYDALNM